MAFRVSCRTALFGKRDDVVRLKSFFSLGDHELHRLPFFQGTVAVDFDGAVMDENIAALLAFDEAEPFCIVKPFDLAFFLARTAPRSSQTAPVGPVRLAPFLI